MHNLRCLGFAAGLHCISVLRGVGELPGYGVFSGVCGSGLPVAEELCSGQMHGWPSVHFDGKADGVAMLLGFGLLAKVC